MLATITGRFLKFQSEVLPRFATPSVKTPSRTNAEQEKGVCLVKEEEFASIGAFVKRLVPHASHLSHTFDYLPKVYHDLATAEIAKENGAVSDSVGATDGEYTLSADISTNSLYALNEADVSIVELDGEGRAMFCKKLVYAAERVVISCHSCYHFADVRYLMHLVDHLDEVPRIMKNGKGNIFAGTIIMVGDTHYVPVAKFSDGTFEVELISFDSKLENVAQFVIIERNR